MPPVERAAQVPRKLASSGGRVLALPIVNTPERFPLRLIGAPPFDRREDGRLISRIATLFPAARTLVTTPGVHATQRVAFADQLNAERAAAGQPPLTPEETQSYWAESVDLLVDENLILIRPSPDEMDLAFAADEILQECFSKRQIRFLNVDHEGVRQAIKARGECWRIAPLPRTPAEMATMIREAISAIALEPIYYHSRFSGSRFLTLEQFLRLEKLPDAKLAAQLTEIREYSARRNRWRNPEIAFFLTADRFGASQFQNMDFLSMSSAALRESYAKLKQAFREAVPPDLWRDDLENTDWRNRMFAALMGRADETIVPELLWGLSPEFFMQIEWLPGGRIEDGELLFDPVFEEADRRPDDTELRTLCDEKAKGFIFNFIREFGDIEYVNIGRVIGSLSRREPSQGRRDVYLAEIKQAGTPQPHVRILRMQKWGIREHLEEGKDLLQAIMEAEDYTDYILDRRMGCRQLGMNLPRRVVTRKLSERYFGSRREYEGQRLWSTYFEREYIPGMATDKLPRARFRSRDYALRFAALLGQAAAPNLIVGRLNLQQHTLFDDGDEVLLEDAAGLPAEIVVSDHTGTFMEYQRPLELLAPDYAEPINKRLAHVDAPVEMAETYLEAFRRRFEHIQADYRKRRRAFDTLFKHRRRDPAGSFAYRWEKVLERLDASDAGRLAEVIRRNLVLPA